MKYRNDFVTNSSSSSFILTIKIETNDNIIEFDANGGTPETGRIDYFENDAIVKVSPKQLGTAESIEELIQLLTDGVLDGNEWEEDGEKIFESSHPIDCPIYDDSWEYGIEPRFKTFDAYNFIKEIKENIKSMDDVVKITISGREENYEEYIQTYEYNRKTKVYTGYIYGNEIEKDGASGGCIIISDTDECDLTTEGYQE